MTLLITTNAWKLFYWTLKSHNGNKPTTFPISLEVPADMILLGKLASFLLWWTTHKTILLQQSIIFLDSFHSTYNRLRTKSTKPDGEKESRGREKKATARIFPYSATGVTEPIFNLFWFPTQSSRCKKVCHLRDLVSRKRIDLTLFLAYFLQIMSTTEFYIDGLALISVSIFGIIGTLLSIRVLLKPELRNSFSTFLLGLAIADTNFLLFVVLVVGLPNFWHW